MCLFQEIQEYTPVNEQEKRDREMMLQYMRCHEDCLSRDDPVAHFTVSAWTVDPARTKTLMVYHRIYDSWSWIGGHADGEPDLKKVALRELREETGIRDAALAGDEIFSLEILAVNGHQKKGRYVPSHLHLNVTYLAEADAAQPLRINPEENVDVRWWPLEEAVRVSNEPWMAEQIYQKLIRRCRVSF